MRGSDLRRQLAQQAEEAARQLEAPVARAEPPDFAERGATVQQAADAMRRAAANGDPSAAGQAAAAAPGDLRQVPAGPGSQGQRAERDIKDAQRQAEEIRREHREIAQRSARPRVGRKRAAAALAQQVADRRAELGKKVAALENQLDRTAAEIAREARDASRKVQGRRPDPRRQDQGEAELLTPADRLREPTGSGIRAHPRTAARRQLRIAAREAR